MRNNGKWIYRMRLTLRNGLISPIFGNQENKFENSFEFYEDAIISKVHFEHDGHSAAVI